MDKTFRPLKSAAKALLKFLDENDVFDEGANDGEGVIDTWRSDQFEQLIESLRSALQETKTSKGIAESHRRT